MEKYECEFIVQRIGNKNLAIVLRAYGKPEHEQNKKLLADMRQGAIDGGWTVGNLVEVTENRTPV